MDSAERLKLQPDEMETARHIWLALKKGAPNAHSQLEAAPDNIRDAILTELTRAMDRRKTTNNPFE
jgi:hypothetical protein